MMMRAFSPTMVLLYHRHHHQSDAPLLNWVDLSLIKRLILNVGTPASLRTSPSANYLSLRRTTHSAQQLVTASSRMQFVQDVSWKVGPHQHAHTHMTQLADSSRRSLATWYLRNNPRKTSTGVGHPMLNDLAMQGRRRDGCARVPESDSHIIIWAESKTDSEKCRFGRLFAWRQTSFSLWDVPLQYCFHFWPWMSRFTTISLFLMPIVCFIDALDTLATSVEDMWRSISSP